MSAIRIACPACRLSFDVDRLPPPGAPVTCPVCQKSFPFRLTPTETAPPSPASTPPTPERTPSPEPTPKSTRTLKLIEPGQPPVHHPPTALFSGLVAALLLLVFVGFAALTVVAIRVTNLLERPAGPAEVSQAPALPNGETNSATTAPNESPAAQPEPSSSGDAPANLPAPVDHAPTVGLLYMPSAQDDGGQRRYRPLWTVWAIDRQHFVTPASQLAASGIDRLPLQIVVGQQRYLIDGVRYPPKFPVDRIRTVGRNLDQLTDEEFDAMMEYDFAFLEVTGLGIQPFGPPPKSTEQLAKENATARVVGQTESDDAPKRPNEFHPMPRTVDSRLNWVAINEGKHLIEICAPSSTMMRGSPVVTLQGHVIGIFLRNDDEDRPASERSGTPCPTPDQGRHLILPVERILEFQRKLKVE